MLKLNGSPHVKWLRRGINYSKYFSPLSNSIAIRNANYVQDALAVARATFNESQALQEKCNRLELENANLYRQMKSSESAKCKLEAEIVRHQAQARSWNFY
jgi:hypothetical protein